VVLQLRVQPELAERIRRLARETGQTLARVVETALDAISPK
jgi:predicted DNA-binding protein